jgi:uncharacterized ParB-like nuclease family protein
MAQHINISKFATSDAPTEQVPMRVINRPLPSELDEDKVERFMEDIKVRREAFSTPYRASLTLGTTLG